MLSYKIIQDPEPSDPRVENDNVGKMICFHRRYRLGDKHEFKTPKEFEDWWAKQKGIRLPLYLYDHSGLRISTNPFGCPWDSGQVGYIYVTEAKIKEEWGRNKVKAVSYLQGEVAEYNQYLSGDIYGYQIRDEDNNLIDSLTGIYGEKEAEEEAQKALVHLEKKVRAEANLI